MNVSTEEFQTKVLGSVERLATTVKAIGSQQDRLKDAINGLHNTFQNGNRMLRLSDPATRAKGSISDGAAAMFAASVILHVAKSGKMEGFISDTFRAKRVVDEAKSIAGSDSAFGEFQHKALSATEIPLPTVYTGQFQELIAEFGVARKYMTPYPMTGNIDKPPRVGTRPAFGFIAMSSSFPEKKPTIEFGSLENHKVGGIVIVPREINEQSIVAMGQFLARYAAVEFARIEDTIAFLADGTGTYENIKGVCQIAYENNKLVTMGSGLLAPSDTTLDHFRAMRTECASAAISGGAYHLNQTWEGHLRSFKTAADPDCFMYRPDGTATLDGFPIIWTEVMPPFSTTDSANTFFALFGKLRFWLFGQRGGPRIDASEDAFFQYDQVATRFIEELDVEYQAVDAMSVLRSAAS